MMVPEQEPKISVCICTYKRVALLQKCVELLLVQTVVECFEILVVDNDADRSAEEAVLASATVVAPGRRVRYVVEPLQSISAARNRAIREARGAYIAFIDDDESAPNEWLALLWLTLKKNQADAVFGPVLTDRSVDVPVWVSRLDLFARDVGRTGQITPRTALRSGNVLFRKDLFGSNDLPFDMSLGWVGGEDWLAFALAQDAGAKYVSCEEAELFEFLPPSRLRIGWHLRRQFRGGFVFSYSLRTKHSTVVAAAKTMGWVVRGWIGGLIKCLRYIDSPRLLVYSLALCGAAQFGKIGYWFDWRLEEYRFKAAIPIAKRS